MESMFKFEKKIGWAEVIAALALLTSFVTAWYNHVQVAQNLPDLQFESQPAIRVGTSIPDKYRKIVAILPFIVTNRGGRTATLIKLERDSLPPIIQVEDGKAKIENDVITEFSLLDKKANSKDQLSSIVDSEVKPLNLPQFINEPIESGKSRTFVLLLKFRSENGFTSGNMKILFSLRAVFSDGTTFRLAQGFGMQ